MVCRITGMSLGGTLLDDGATVCVFCGSRPGTDPGYLREARAVGRGIAELGLRTVYGGASVGLMGALADAAMEAGGRVVSVVPDCLRGPEARHPSVKDVVEVRDLHERKRAMFSMSSAFVALPGGIGTLDEVFEVLAWSQLRDGGVDGKPLMLLDAGGFFEPLLDLLRHADRGGFLPSGDGAPSVSSFPDADFLLTALGSALRRPSRP